MFIIVRNIFIILVPWYILSLDIGGLHLKASEIVLIILSMLSLKNLRVSKTIQKISIEGILSKPIVYKNYMYIYTTQKIFKFKHTLLKPIEEF